MQIRGTGSATPAQEVPTARLLALALPGRDPVQLQPKIGIDSRGWLGPGESVTGLAAAAARGALASAGVSPGALRRVVVATSTGGDHHIPTVANGVIGELGLDDSCDGFDVHNACTGFLSALDIGARSVATGLGPVLVVAVEAFSPALLPSAHRAYLVLGDAAAAVVLDEGEGTGLRPCFLANSAALRGRMVQPHLHTMAAPTYTFDTAGEVLLASALEHISRACGRVLDEAGLGWDDVDWFLPHQPNGHMLDALVAAMGVPPGRLVPVVQRVGSVGAAAVPVSLDVLYRSGRLRPGDCVLMATVGSGTAYGAVLYQVPG